MAEVGGVGEIAEGAVNGSGGGNFHSVAGCLREAAAQAFIEARGGFAGGGEEADAEPEVFGREFGDLLKEHGGDGGFAGAGAAGDDGKLSFKSGKDGILLTFRQGGTGGLEFVGADGVLDFFRDGDGVELGEDAEFFSDESFVVPESAEIEPSFFKDEGGGGGAVADETGEVFEQGENDGRRREAVECLVGECRVIARSGGIFGGFGGNVAL